MNYAQAVHVLQRMRDAAPPTASARINDVIYLLASLYNESRAPRMTATQEVYAANAAAKQAASDDDGETDHLFVQSVEVLLPFLTVLRGQITAVRSGKLGKLNPDQDGVLVMAEQQAEAALGLVDSLDQLLRLRLDQVEIHLEPFDGSEAINRAWQRVAERSDARGHAVMMRFDDPLPHVVGDPALVGTILADLFINAIQYTQYGGMIRIAADSLGTHVLFSVEDNGIGIGPEDRVGEPFWRGIYHPLVRQHPGTGLRLHLARQLLQLMGGELFFSGESGAGSTFSFTLPAVMTRVEPD